jgi:hypothetical protein
MKKFMIILLFVAILVTGCALADLPFVEGYTAVQLVMGLVTIVLTITQSYFPKISIIQWVKKIFNIQNELASLFVMAFIFGIAALAMLITGELDPSITWDLKQVAVYYGILLSISKAAYQRLKSATGMRGTALLP